MPIKHFLRFDDFSREELDYVFSRTRFIKDRFKRYQAYHPLADRTLVMIFEKASTRTRLSFEAGMHQLGGAAIYLNTRDSQLGRGEPVEDAAQVISRMCDIVMIRTFEQTIVERFAAHSRVPVINGLTNEYHPCQVLADVFTYIEHRGSIQGRTVAWVGDANNMSYTWIQAARLLDFKVHVSTPAGLPDRPGGGQRRRSRPLQPLRRPDGGMPRRRPGHDRRLDQHGLRGGGRRAPPRVRRLLRRRGDDGSRRPVGAVHALPAGASRRRSHRRRHRRHRSRSSGTKPRTGSTCRRRCWSTC